MRKIIALSIATIITFSCGQETKKSSLEELNEQKIILVNQIDSLKFIETENRRPKIYPFNPNYITDYKGYALGMSAKEIDRLRAYRAKNKWVNTSKEFQRVTKVSDPLLKRIAPYFKFPDWVVKRNQGFKNKNVSSSAVEKSFIDKSISTTDINKATADDLQTINGIGPAFSERIVKYRTKLQGFTFEDQLNEVWGLEKEVVDKFRGYSWSGWKTGKN